MMPLYVAETGPSGSPSIIFLHGAGTGGWMWARQIAAFDDFHCLNVDLPGHGSSNHITWLSLADTCDQIAALIRERATNARAHIVGLSLGAYIALVLLERHADVADHVVISGVTVAPVPNRALLNLQLWLMFTLIKSRWFVRMQARSMRVPQDLQPAFTENLMVMSTRAYRTIAEEVVVFNLPAALQSVQTPTLVTAGSRESKIIIEAVHTIPKVMPNAQGCLAPRLGHGWNVEDPALFNQMVRAWINGTRLPAQLQIVHTTHAR